MIALVLTCSGCHTQTLLDVEAQKKILARLVRPADAHLDCHCGRWQWVLEARNPKNERQA